MVGNQYQIVKVYLTYWEFAFSSGVLTYTAICVIVSIIQFIYEDIYLHDGCLISEIITNHICPLRTGFFTE